MTVQDIIRACGGAIKVARASRQTASPVTFEAVFKWYRNGIPEAHWPLVMKMGGLTVEQIYTSNRLVERQKSKRRRPRNKGQVAIMSAA